MWRGEGFRIGLIEAALIEGYFIKVSVTLSPGDNSLRISIRHDQTEVWHHHDAIKLTIDVPEARSQLFDYMLNLVRLTAP